MFLILIPCALFSQQEGYRREHFCKAWKLEQFQEADGKKYPPPVEMKKDYIQFNCDGTFQSSEMGTLIKGRWFFDGKTAILTTTQSTNKSYPAKIESKVLRVTETELVTVSRDAEGRKQPLYMKKV